MGTSGDSLACHIKVHQPYDDSFLFHQTLPIKSPEQ